MNQIVVILNLIISDDYHFVPAFQPRQNKIKKVFASTPGTFFNKPGFLKNPVVFEPLQVGVEQRAKTPHAS